LWEIPLAFHNPYSVTVVTAEWDGHTETKTDDEMLVECGSSEVAREVVSEVQLRRVSTGNAQSKLACSLHLPC
jgi:hypothetical protein